MRIVHLFRFTPHGGLSPEHLSSGTRGVTGSEQALISFAEASAQAGHRVVVYIPTGEPFLHKGVWYMDIESAYPRFSEIDEADAVIAWLSADPLIGMPKSVFRVMVFQINDWSMSVMIDRGFKHVDKFIAQSNSHRDWLFSRGTAPDAKDRCDVITNGIWMNRYEVNPRRIPHRLITCSSPDRGIHILLHLWPEIRLKVPDATLHIYYEVRKWIEGMQQTMSEIGQRARFIRDRLERLEGHGVYLHNAVPPMTLAKELCKSDFYVYPCWTVSFTEGFSVSTMEACASGTVPLMTDMDSLGELYRDSGAVVIRIKDRRTTWMDEYRDKLIEMLTSGRVSEEPDLSLEDRRLKCRRFAEAYDYSILGPNFNRMIEDGVAAKGRSENQSV